MIVVRPKDTESKLTVKSYTPGDVNSDGAVSVTDVGCAINYILEQVPSVFIFEAADMNGDKSVSVTDVGMIINCILSGIDDDTMVAVYDLAGRQVGHAVGSGGTATVSTTLRDGDKAIVKVGQRTVKLIVKP